MKRSALSRARRSGPGRRGKRRRRRRGSSRPDSGLLPRALASASGRSREHDVLLGEIAGPAAPGSMPPWPASIMIDRPRILALGPAAPQAARGRPSFPQPPCGNRRVGPGELDGGIGRRPSRRAPWSCRRRRPDGRAPSPPGSARREKAVAKEAISPSLLRPASAGRWKATSGRSIMTRSGRSMTETCAVDRLRQCHLEACLPAIRLDRCGRGDGGRSGLFPLRRPGAFAPCGHDDGHEAGADEAYDEGERHRRSPGVRASFLYP